MTSKTKDTLYSLYIVHVIISMLTFFLAYGFFLILGYGHEMFYAMLCAVFALIPFLGPVLILMFVGLYALCISDWYGAILISTVGYFFICVMTDMILRPKLIGKRIQIRPILMFLGFFGGAMTMGLLGFVLGPVLLVLGITGYEIFFKEMRQMKTPEPADT
jgi:predicted PurR-regulated permease PerM